MTRNLLIGVGLAGVILLATIGYLATGTIFALEKVPAVPLIFVPAIFAILQLVQPDGEPTAPLRRGVGTSRLVLAGILGVLAAAVVFGSAAELIEPRLLVAPVLVAAGLVGFLWAVLVLGHLLPPVARLALCVLMPVALVPLAHFTCTEKQVRKHIAELEAIDVPLMAPDLPGYRVTWAYGSAQNNSLTLDLEPISRPTSGQQRIRIAGAVLPVKFNPPDSCGDYGYFGPTQVYCTQAGPDIWRRYYGEWIMFYRRIDNWLFHINGHTDVGEDNLRQAARSLHRVPARELAKNTRLNCSWMRG